MQKSSIENILSCIKNEMHKKGFHLNEDTDSTFFKHLEQILLKGIREPEQIYQELMRLLKQDIKFSDLYATDEQFRKKVQKEVQRIDKESF